MCKQCHCEKNRLWYEANRDRVREQQRRWREANSEKKQETDRHYREANRDREREQDRRYREANRDRERERLQRWREANPDKVLEYGRRYCEANRDTHNAKNHRRRARINGNGGSYTDTEWQEVCERQAHRCACCGEKKKLTVDHVLPIDRGGSNYITNIQALCRSCNSRKGTQHIDYRLDWT